MEFNLNREKFKGLEEIGSPEYIDLKKPIDESGFYVFISFDLVKSTEFKESYSYWSEYFTSFYSNCEATLKREFKILLPKLPTRIQVWKKLGDEILFYIKITDLYELLVLPKAVDISLLILNNGINNYLTKERISTTKLGLKATMWSAFIDDPPFEIQKRKKREKHRNIILRHDYQRVESFVQNNDRDDNFDFIGCEIDIGFRLTKYSSHELLIVSAELSLLLYKIEQYYAKFTKDDLGIASNLRIVTFKQMKGVWKGRFYPIVLYSITLDKIKDNISYDCTIDDNLVHLMISEELLNDNLNISKLEGIFKERREFATIDRLYKYLVDNNTDEIKIPKNGLV